MELTREQKATLTLPGSVVDVPITLTVAVRGEHMSTEDLLAAARRFGERLCETAISAPFLWAYNDAEASAGGLSVVTEASLEIPSDEVAEELEELLSEASE